MSPHPVFAWEYEYGTLPSNSSIGVEQPVPHPAGRPAARHRLIDRLGGDPEVSRERAGGMPTHRHPEIGNPRAGARHGAMAASRLEAGWRQADLTTNPGEEGVEGEAGRADWRARRHLLLQLVHKRRTPEHALIAQIGLPAPAEGGDCRPAPLGPAEPPALEVGSAPLREPLRHK